MFKGKTILLLTAVFMLLALLLAGCGQTTPAPATQTAPLKISTSSLANGQVGIMYSQTLKATGGNGPYTWKIYNGSLPDGLNLNTNNGGINGMPNNAGTFKFTVQVSDSTNSANQSLLITVKPSLTPLVFDTTSLKNGEVGASYSRTLSASGGSGIYTWSILSGSLPDGLSLNATTGTISGTPGTTGVFSFTVQVDDGTGANRSHSLSLTIVTALVITTTNLMEGAVGVNYYQVLSASGGSGNYAWKVSSGSLPDGLILDGQYGEIYGPPKTAGVFNFAVQVDDGISNVARSFSIKIGPPQKPIVIDIARLADGKAGTAYYQTLKASGGSNIYTWSILSGSLPDGLSLDAKTGTISGTPKTAGTFKFTAHILDSVGSIASGDLSITVTAN